ncbi:MAG TPA: divalent metal cation transporter [Gammaproteobacteria bacterium]|nr:divalent metal cation transporter [Gammaproteobacteria bacterium]
MGPGLITGAADDDPSGIATYSIVGAQLGNSMLWTSLLTWPLMAATQMMCARIGMVTGRGLAFGLKKKFPRWLVVVAALALLVANTINIGADLAGMADAVEMLSGTSSHFWVVLFAMGISWATVQLRYAQIANTLKWLAVFLFSYVLCALVVKPNWHAIMKSVLLPSLPRTSDEWQMLVALLGTTISPYLFFWQTSQEVEEEKASGRRTRRARRNATPDEILNRKLDVGIGTFFSNMVMFFIMVTTAATLHRHGILHIETSREAAEALRPIAGDGAAILYTMGIIGVGLLAIPTLSGSAAYAIAEVFGWRRQGLDEKAHKARAFYAVVLLATAAALGLDFSDVNPVRALYWTAVINGVLAPVLLFGILAVAMDRHIMAGQPSSNLGRTMVAITAVIMSSAAVAMFVV